MKLNYQKDLFFCYTEYSAEQTWILRIFYDLSIVQWQYFCDLNLVFVL